jgi:hypothetical protein
MAEGWESRGWREMDLTMQLGMSSIFKKKQKQEMERGAKPQRIKKWVLKPQKERGWTPVTVFNRISRWRAV